MSGAITALSAVAGNPAIQALAGSLPIPSALQAVLLRSPRRIGTIIPDVVIEEDLSDRVTVTQHPVMNGVPVSDHAYRMPYQVTMRCGWTNANAIGNALAGFGSSLAGGASFSDAISAGGTQLVQSFTEQRVTAIYAALRKLQFDNDALAQGNIPVRTFVLVTGKRTYPNMVVTELSVRTDRASEYSLMVEVHFQEVMIVTTKYTTQPAQTDQAQPAQTASPSDGGDKTVTPTDAPPQSTLSKVIGGTQPPAEGRGRRRAMTTFYEIPLSGTPQAFNITLPQSNTQPAVQYRLVLQYRNAPMGGWTMDIYDGQGDPVLCGAPLVTGADLLAQFAYLDLGGGIAVYSDGIPDAVPTFDNLGSGSHVMWFTAP